MTKKLFIISICSILSLPALANNMPPMPPANGPDGAGPRGDIFAQLTDEQKSCIETYGCKMPERPAMDEQNAQPAPDKKTEMTDEQKESMKCVENAMKQCGIELPEPPRNERPEHPMFFPNGPRPEHPNNQ